MILILASLFLEHSVETENSYEVNGQEKRCFEAVPKKNQSALELSDVGQQTVPEVASSHQKCRTADSRQPCTRCEADDDRRRWRSALVMRWM